MFYLAIRKAVAGPASVTAHPFWGGGGLVSSAGAMPYVWSTWGSLHASKIRDALAPLCKEDLIALILAQGDVIARQTAQIEALRKRVEDLEAKLGKPPKTPDNSSVPPSQGQKPNRAERRAAKKRKGHPGAFRALSENPDRVIEARAEACPHCAHALSAVDQPGFHAYDHVELPPIKPVVTRIHRHRGTCPCCRRGFSAPTPEGMAPGSPFGPGLVALILHLYV